LAGEKQMARFAKRNHWRSSPILLFPQSVSTSWLNLTTHTVPFVAWPRQGQNPFLADGQNNPPNARVFGLPSSLIITPEAPCFLAGKPIVNPTNKTIKKSGSGQLDQMQPNYDAPCSKKTKSKPWNQLDIDSTESNGQIAHR